MSGDQLLPVLFTAVPSLLSFSLPSNNKSKLAAGAVFSFSSLVGLDENGRAPQLMCLILSCGGYLVGETVGERLPSVAWLEEVCRWEERWDLKRPHPRPSCGGSAWRCSFGFVRFCQLLVLTPFYITYLTGKNSVGPFDP